MGVLLLSHCAQATHEIQDSPAHCSAPAHQGKPQLSETGFVFVIQTAKTIAFVILARSDAETAALIVAVSYEASP
jgi:hypothetical protein